MKGPADSPMDTATLKAALLSPAIYPGCPQEIDFIETHISLLFLTGTHVYKVKKPVNFGFLDFSSLEKREYYCHQEVILNCRLAQGLYLGVVRLTEDEGRVTFDGKGKVVDFAVEMKQISEAFLLDQLLRRGEMTPEMMEAVVEKLVRFYSVAETNDTIKSFARPERIKQDTDENFAQTEAFVDRTISGQIFREIKEKTNDFLRRRRETFYGRIASDRIRDCHGDLRLEHIFWGDPILIFDCIEFNERFRYTDVAADIGFLTMDLDYHGREDLSEGFLRDYVAKSDDRGLMDVLDFYRCYRAYVRGKVESLRLGDPSLPSEEEEGAKHRAQKYFLLAHRYAGRL